MQKEALLQGEGEADCRSLKISCPTPVEISIASLNISSAGAILSNSFSPSAFSTMAWWRRSNRGMPTKRSSAWTRRLSAGEDKESFSAAALTDPSRATCTKASMDVRGGSRRTRYFLLESLSNSLNSRVWPSNDDTFSSVKMGCEFCNVKCFLRNCYDAFASAKRPCLSGILS